jgi:hypothetical protein
MRSRCGSSQLTSFIMSRRLIRKLPHRHHAWPPRSVLTLSPLAISPLAFDPLFTLEDIQAFVPFGAAYNAHATIGYSSAPATPASRRIPSPIEEEFPRKRQRISRRSSVISSLVCYLPFLVFSPLSRRSTVDTISSAASFFEERQP